MVVRLIEAARLEQVSVVIPPVAVAETIRGGGRDAPIHRMLRFAEVPPFGLTLARRAGMLLAQSGTSNVADAQVMAEALSGGPAVVITSDPNDMHQLAAGQAGIRVIPV